MHPGLHWLQQCFSSKHTEELTFDKKDGLICSGQSAGLTDSYWETTPTARPLPVQLEDAGTDI